MIVTLVYLTSSECNHSGWRFGGNDAGSRLISQPLSKEVYVVFTWPVKFTRLKFGSLMIQSYKYAGIELKYFIFYINI